MIKRKTCVSARRSVSSTLSFLAATAAAAETIIERVSLPPKPPPMRFVCESRRVSEDEGNARTRGTFFEVKVYIMRGKWKRRQNGVPWQRRDWQGCQGPQRPSFESRGGSACSQRSSSHPILRKGHQIFQKNNIRYK